MKIKGLKEADFLALLQKVLPKATSDPHLASAIYEQVAKEVNLIKSLQTFEKFCEEGSLPDLTPETVSDLQTQLSENFGAANVALTPDENGGAMAVEITCGERTLSSKLKVAAPGEELEEVKPVFVPFPVSLPQDPELIWLMARREDLGPDEAMRALALIEEEFWATKAGQKLIKEGADRCFAEFVEAVPAAALKESGMKRHYKTPEALKVLQLLAAKAPESLSATLA